MGIFTGRGDSHTEGGQKHRGRQTKRSGRGIRKRQNTKTGDKHTQVWGGGPHTKLYWQYKVSVRKK